MDLDTLLEPAGAVAVVATAVALAGWLVLFGIMLLADRVPPIRPGPTTAELGPESPALVDYITGDWEVTDEAASGTVLDLAARGFVQIEEIGPELSLVRLGRADQDRLRPYERLVLDHLHRLARDGVVPTAALAEGARHLGRWWSSFRRKVIAEARSEGLTRRRWGRGQLLVLGIAAVVPVIAAGIAGIPLETDDGDNGAIATAGLTAILLGLLVQRANRERGTRKGADAAGAWLGVRSHLAANRQLGQCPAAGVTIWGRHLAYAAALGLAPRAVASLPVSLHPDAVRAWSDYGGMWHPVEVRYPRLPMRGVSWGRAVFQGLIIGLMVAGPLFVVLVLVIVFAGADLRPDLISLAVVLALPALAFALGVSDLFSHATVEGQVVRLLAGGGDTPAWVAIDDGRHRRTLGYGMTPELAAELCEGDIVRARVGRGLRRVRGVEVLTPSRFRQAVEYDDAEDRSPGGAQHPIAAAMASPVGAFLGWAARRNGVARDDALLDRADPVGLVTAEDIRAALGFEVGPPERQESDAGRGRLATATRSCRYPARDGGPSYVDVCTGTGPTAGLLMLAAGESGRPRQVAGIGLGALAGPGVICAQVQGGVVVIRVSSPHGPPPPGALERLAGIATARLVPAPT